MFSTKNEKRRTKNRKILSYVILSIGIIPFFLIASLALNSKTINDEPLLFIDAPIPDHLNSKKNKVTKDIKVSNGDMIKNKSDLYKFMKKSKVKFPELVWAQAMLESSWMSAPVFNRANNLFGMKKSGQRPNLQIHLANDQYSHYKTIEYCVIDYCLHQAYVLKVQNIKSESGYLSRLNETKYAESGGYTKKILALRNSTDFNKML